MTKHKAVRYLPRGIAQYLKSRQDSHATLLGMIEANDWLTVNEITQIDNRDWKTSLSTWLIYCDHAGLFDTKWETVNYKKTSFRKVRQDYREPLKVFLEGLMS